MELVNSIFWNLTDYILENEEGDCYFEDKRTHKIYVKYVDNYGEGNLKVTAFDSFDEAAEYLKDIYDEEVTFTEDDEDIYNRYPQ